MIPSTIDSVFFKLFDGVAADGASDCSSAMRRQEVYPQEGRGLPLFQ